MNDDQFLMGLIRREIGIMAYLAGAEFLCMHVFNCLRLKHSLRGRHHGIPGRCATVMRMMLIVLQALA